MIIYQQILCICSHANEGHKSKTKDTEYKLHISIGQFQIVQ